MAVLAKVTVGGVLILEVDASPNGSVTAPKGTLAIEKVTPAYWINTDGATTWTQLR